jgi:hypothetical protein
MTRQGRREQARRPWVCRVLESVIPGGCTSLVTLDVALTAFIAGKCPEIFSSREQSPLHSVVATNTKNAKSCPKSSCILDPYYLVSQLRV